MRIGSRWARRAGVAGFVFFLAKGVAWLVLAAGAAAGLVGV